jgi:hypothetical protein
VYGVHRTENGPCGKVLVVVGIVVIAFVIGIVVATRGVGVVDGRRVVRNNRPKAIGNCVCGRLDSERTDREDCWDSC